MSLISQVFSTEAGLAAIFSAVATLLSVLIAHLLRGRVKLITFSPNSTYFQLRPTTPGGESIHIRSGQVVIQNLGRQSAKDVQITSVPGGAPAGYVILPSLVHSTRLGTNNEWILEIPFVAPREVITVQILNGCNIDSVRSSGGAARHVPVMHQRVFPRWLNALIFSLMMWGVVSFFYFIGYYLLRT